MYGAVRTKGSQFHEYHKALRVRMPYQRAILATAHRMLRTIVVMPRDSLPYIDPDIDCEAPAVERNASRWLGKLVQHGCLDRIRSGGVASAS